MAFLTTLLAAPVAVALAAGPSPALPEPVAFEASAAAARPPAWQAYAPVAASALVPGSGQLWQGQVAKGVGQLGAAALCLAAIGYSQSQIGNTASPMGSDGGVRVLASAGLLALAIWSPLDALAFKVREDERK